MAKQRCLALLLLLIAAVVGGHSSTLDDSNYYLRTVLASAGDASTKGSATAYDAPVVTQVEVLGVESAGVTRALSLRVREAFASPAVEDRRTSTTPFSLSNATKAARTGTAIEPYYPANNGFHGAPKPTTLQPGATFDRYGSDFGRFTSPTGTPMHQRALPPGAEDGAYSTFRVVEPLTVEAGQVAPAFGSFGGGTQYLMPDSIKKLLESGVIERVTP